MIRFASLFLFLLCALPAQCFGTFPAGVTGVGTTPGDRCSDIPGTTLGPFCSPSAAISASNGGPFFLTASNLPLVSSAPVFFQSALHLDFGQLPGPAPLPSGCASAYVAPLFAFNVLLFNTGACQSVLVVQVPPLPGFAGVQLYGQVFMYDSIRVAWASSNVFVMTFQP
jgi:hypothetical protein